ncbi:MAG: arylamine N-acetyltransferase [Pseudomonadota bacterium]
MITKDELLKNTLLMEQLHNYFLKIHFPTHNITPQLAVVKNLCAKHRRNFAYSTLRINLGMNTRCTFEALLSDLLTDSAGHCVHHNAIVYLALIYIGFTVDLIKANMAEQNNPSNPSDIAPHLAIVLTLNSQRYLVDPGTYARFTALQLPIDNLVLSENHNHYQIIKNPNDVSNFILQKKKKESWVNAHFFSTDPIKLSELNASLPNLLSKKNQNYDHLILCMFHRKKHIGLFNRDIFFSRGSTSNSAYTFIEQPSVFYALTTLELVSAEFAEASRKAQTLLRQHPLVNGYLAEDIRCQSPSISSTASPFILK